MIHGAQPGPAATTKHPMLTLLAETMFFHSRVPASSLTLPRRPRAKAIAPKMSSSALGGTSQIASPDNPPDATCRRARSRAALAQRPNAVQNAPRAAAQDNGCSTRLQSGQPPKVFRAHAPTGRVRAAAGRSDKTGALYPMSPSSKSPTAIQHATLIQP